MRKNSSWYRSVLPSYLAGFLLPSSGGPKEKEVTQEKAIFHEGRGRITETKRNNRGGGICYVVMWITVMQCSSIDTTQPNRKATQAMFLSYSLFI